MGLTERHLFENEDVPENYEWDLEDAVRNSRTNKKEEFTEQRRRGQSCNFDDRIERSKGRMKKKVFISLPMSGLDVDTIFDHLVSAKEEYLDRNRVELKDVVFVDNLFTTPRPPEGVPETHHGVWYLSYALTKLSACDEAFFYGNWKEARGCQIEHEVCEKYGIPFTEV